MSVKEEILSPASSDKWRDMARAMMAKGQSQSSAETMADASVRPDVSFLKKRLMHG